MTCRNNSSCTNLCCRFCNAKDCIYRCYKNYETCGDFKAKKIKSISPSESKYINPVIAPKGTKYTEKPTNAEFKKMLIKLTTSKDRTHTSQIYKYSEEDVAEMRYWQEMNKSENRHKDLSKQELISELSKYDIKFSTASKKEELRVLLVSLEDSCTPKKPVEAAVSKGRKPRIDKEFKRAYGHLSKAELIKLAKSKKIEVLPTESMNDIIKKIESKK